MLKEFDLYERHKDVIDNSVIFLDKISNLVTKDLPEPLYLCYKELYIAGGFIPCVVNMFRDRKNVGLEGIPSLDEFLEKRELYNYKEGMDIDIFSDSLDNPIFNYYKEKINYEKYREDKFNSYDENDQYEILSEQQGDFNPNFSIDIEGFKFSINCSHTAEAKKLIKGFDFIHIMCYYNILFKQLNFCGNSFEYILTKKLKTNPKYGRLPNKDRIQKYLNRGYN